MESQDRENVDAYEVCLRYIEAKWNHKIERMLMLMSFAWDILKLNGNTGQTFDLNFF